MSKVIFSTNGSGLWSHIKKNVTITKLHLEKDWSELRVYFDTNDWNIFEDGLIYTDKKFLDDLKDYLKNIGIWDSDRISYSEQGMQEVDYVSLDVTDDFIDGWESIVFDSVLLV